MASRPTEAIGGMASISVRSRSASLVLEKVPSKEPVFRCLDPAKCCREGLVQSGVSMLDACDGCACGADQGEDDQDDRELDTGAVLDQEDDDRHPEERGGDAEALAETSPLQHRGPPTEAEKELVENAEETPLQHRGPPTEAEKELVGNAEETPLQDSPPRARRARSFRPEVAPRSSGRETLSLQVDPQSAGSQTPAPERQAFRAFDRRGAEKPQNFAAFSGEGQRLDRDQEDSAPDDDSPPPSPPSHDHDLEDTPEDDSAFDARSPQPSPPSHDHDLEDLGLEMSPEEGRKAHDGNLLEQWKGLEDAVPAGAVVVLSDGTWAKAADGCERHAMRCIVNLESADGRDSGELRFPREDEREVALDTIVPEKALPDLQVEVSPEVAGIGSHRGVLKLPERDFEALYREPPDVRRYPVGIESASGRVKWYDLTWQQFDVLRRPISAGGAIHRPSKRRVHGGARHPQSAKEQQAYEEFMKNHADDNFPTASEIEHYEKEKKALPHSESVIGKRHLLIQKMISGLMPDFARSRRLGTGDHKHDGLEEIMDKWAGKGLTVLGSARGATRLGQVVNNHLATAHNKAKDSGRFGEQSIDETAKNLIGSAKSIPEFGPTHGAEGPSVPYAPYE